LAQVQRVVSCLSKMTCLCSLSVCAFTIFFCLAYTVPGHRVKAIAEEAVGTLSGNEQSDHETSDGQLNFLPARLRSLAMILASLIQAQAFVVPRAWTSPQGQSLAYTARVGSSGPLLARSAAPRNQIQVGGVDIPTPLQLFERLNSEEAQKLRQELLEEALQQDVGVAVGRTLDFGQALRTVGEEAIEEYFSKQEFLSTPRVLRRLFESLGATYVKLGQFIASSPTLFPPEYVQEFQNCLDSTPPNPWSEVKPLIEEELGRPIGEVYSFVDETPLAAASIAQVHAAKLLTGEDVVIKVQRKGVQGSLKADLFLLYANARILQLVGLVSDDLGEIVSTIREAILEELDFKLEAERTVQFGEFLDRSPELSGLVTVPKVYPSASASRVLTLERLYGKPLTDLDSVRKYTASPELAVILALNTWLSSVVSNEWFHADVHAGNLLILEDGRIAFIDFGVVGSIPKSTSDAMFDFVRAYPQNDMQGMANALSNMGFTKKLDEETSIAFARDLQTVIESIERLPAADLAAGQIDEGQLNRAVAAVGNVASNYGIRFPRAFALLIKQVLYFDRYTSLLAPDLDILNDPRLAMNRGPPGIAEQLDSVVVDAEVVTKQGESDMPILVADIAKPEKSIGRGADIPAASAATPADSRFAGIVVPTGKSSLKFQLDTNRAVVDSLKSIAPEMTEIELLRFAMIGDRAKAEESLREAVAWRAGAGKMIVESAAAAVAKARAGGGWDNAPVRDAAPHASAINHFITPKNILTLNAADGDLVYVIRASGIEDDKLMSKVSADQLIEFLLYVKEVHWLCANARTQQTGRICEVIFANDISGTRKVPNPDFSRALSGSSESYTKLYPSLAGPTLILNLPSILQGFVGLITPLFPEAVRERLKFEKAKYLSELKDLTPLTTDKNALKMFLKEIQQIVA